MSTSFEPHRVVCALDLGEPIGGVLETATAIASRFDAELHLVHVWDPWVGAAADGALLPTNRDLDALSRSLRLQLDAAADAARRAQLDVKTALVPGRPWEQIVAYAEGHHCDLVVAGTHGRTGLARLMQGSVAERVVRESSVPVLVVPNVEPSTRGVSISDPMSDAITSEDERWGES